MMYSKQFLADFNNRDCVQHGHDPRNHIGFNTGLDNARMVELWAWFILGFKEADSYVKTD